MDDAAVFDGVDDVLIDQGYILDIDAQAGEAVHHLDDVVGATQALDDGLHVLGGNRRGGRGSLLRALGQLELVLTSGRDEVELQDERAEDDEPHGYGDGAHGDDHEPMGQVGGQRDKAGHGLDEAREQGTPARRVQNALEQAVEGGVHDEQDGRRPQVHELERLGDTGENRHEGGGHEHTAHLGAMLLGSDRDEGQNRSDGAEPLAEAELAEAN